MKLRFLFVLPLLFCNLGKSEGYNTVETVSAIQYGVAWNVYWDTALNSWDSESGGYEEAARAVRTMRGKEVQVTVRRSNVPSSNLESHYYAAIHSTNVLAERLLELKLFSRNGHITSVDSGSSSPDSVLVESNLTIRIPNDMTALARIPPKPDEIALVKKGLRAFTSRGSSKQTQHFFVGPFNKWSPKVIIYWLEERRFIEVGYPSETPSIPIESQFIQGKTIRIDDDKKGELTAEELLRVEKSRVFWVNRWIANCVHDGVLVEVKP